VRAAACGGAATCGGNPLPGGLPREEERLGAAQIRIARAGLTWLGEHANDLIRQFVPGGLSFNIQESSQLGGLVVICPASDHPQGCPFSVTLTQAVLIPGLPAVLVANLFLDIPKQDIPVTAFGTDCEVSVTARRTPVQIDFAFEIDPVTRALAVLPTVRPLSGDNLDITGSGLCATVTLFRGYLLGKMQEELQKNLTETLEDRMCLSCASGCPAPAACGARDLCRHATGRCVAMRQGVEGQIALAPLLGTVSTQRFSTIRYGFYAGGAASANADALTLGMMGGAGAPERGTCVPAAPERVRSDVPAPALPLNAPDGNPYHVALALSREAVEDLAAAAWRAGGLCLRATSYNVAQLTSDAFTLVLPALARLTGGRSRPVMLGVNLEAEPRVAVGSGASHVDSRGQRVLDEPLLALTLPGLVLDLYVQIEDRMAHVGRVKQDVTLPLGLDFTADGRVGILLGDVTGGVRNARVEEAEILGATSSSLERAVPALLALALPFALRSIRPIEIPSFSGFGLTPRGVRGEPTSGPTHAVIYADLRLVEPALPLRAAARTAAEITSARPGEIELLLGGTWPGSAPLEWSWHLDQGPWSLFTPQERVRIDDPRLWLLGEHRLAVRARAVGKPESLDPEPVTLTFRIGEAPAPRQVARGCEVGGGGIAGVLAALAVWLARRRRT
jgi:hypothetical protein